MATEAAILSSVFGGSSLAFHTTPTPLATPLIGQGSFGGPTSTPVKQAHHDSAAYAQVKKNLAWSTATRYLSLDGLKFDAIVQGSRHSLRPRRPPKDVDEALDMFLDKGLESIAGEKQWDLIEWYTAEVKSHFLNVVEPQLASAWSQSIPVADLAVTKALGTTTKVLAEVQEQYISHLEHDLLPKLRCAEGHDSSEQRARHVATTERMFRTKLHALSLHAFPAQRLTSALSWYMHSHVSILLFENGGKKSSSDEAFFHMLARFQQVGFGDDFGQRAFASAMWKVLDDFITGQYMRVDWDRPQSKVQNLSRFLSHGFIPLVEKCVGILGGTPDDVCQYQKMAVARLGRHRITNLFDYIVRWPQSMGAIRDIKEYINTPEARLSVTASFAEQVQRRLLHAGATTTHILNLYINIIHAFSELDPKGVLLDRVATPIRHYLRHREDTARIIVASLLAEIDENNNVLPDPTGIDVSEEIAKEMNKPIIGLDADEDENMDYDDLNWTPDPVDAGPNFKRSKNQDVTSALLSLYNREDFINELKTILGEHLLRNYDINEPFEKEERLLELFKNRLGEDKLQACEVMLRDVQSSHQMNKTIHRAPAYIHTYNKLHRLDMNTHILSSFFWPSLRDDEFKIPEPVQALREEYEKAFEGVKATRKLRWMTALGRVAVELEFEDRKVEEEVPTWTASVIYAFQSADGKVIEKSVEQLEEELEMDDNLVRNALVFWRSKQVLKENETDTYTVIENLADLSKADKQAAVEPVAMEEDPAVSAVRSQQEVLNENAELYKTFLMGMLTNQGNLPPMRILMMLKVVVPGGFAFGIDEVRGLLQGLVVEGKVVRQGDVYGVRR